MAATEAKPPRVPRLSAFVCSLGALFLLGSMYAPWYRAISTENFCGFLVEPYGADSNSNACGVGLGRVDAWTFSVPSLILLGIALGALAFAHLTLRRPGGTAADIAWISGLLLCLIAPGYVIYRLVVPMGPVDTFTAAYGAWLGLGATLVISTGVATAIWPTGVPSRGRAPAHSTQQPVPPSPS